MMQRISSILAKAKGSRPSYKERLDEDGYEVDVEALIERRAGMNGTKLFVQSKRDFVDFNIVFCLDTSGSMRGVKIESSQKLLANFAKAAEKLKLNTAVVAFAQHAKIVKEFNQKVDQSAIGSSATGTGVGSTFIPEGLALSIMMAEKIAKDSGKRTLILVISDGENSGSTIKKLTTKRYTYVEEQAFARLAVEKEDDLTNVQLAIAKDKRIQVYFVGVDTDAMKCKKFNFDKAVYLYDTTRLTQVIETLAQQFVQGTL